MTKSCTCHQTPTPSYSQIGKPKESSVIGEILALAARPEVISFAGGLPSAEGFPVKAIKDAADWVLETCPQVALQYSAVGGMPALLEAIAKIETDHGVPTTPDEVMIVSGSQQALDMIARVFTDEGDKVLVETPTYMGALYAFELCKPKFVSLPTDDEGLNPDLIDDRVAGAKFAYVMPTYQNPTGRTISEERRRKLAEKARQYDFWLIEDNPYGELYYAERPPVSLRAFAPERTLRLGTMSKVLAPGFRLGYICGPKHVLNALKQMKTSMDLHTSTYTQLITARVLDQDLFSEHLPAVRRLYAEKAKVMLDSLEEFMPKHPEVSWTKPTGGMFIWLNLPKNVDSADLMKKVLASGRARRLRARRSLLHGQSRGQPLPTLLRDGPVREDRGGHQVRRRSAQDLPLRFSRSFSPTQAAHAQDVRPLRRQGPDRHRPSGPFTYFTSALRPAGLPAGFVFVEQRQNRKRPERPFCRQ